MGCMSCHFGKGEGCVSKVQDTSTVCERTMVIKFYKSTPIHTFGAIWSERCLVSEDYVSPDVGEWLAVISGVVRCSLLPSSPPLPILLKCIVHILFIAPGSQAGAPGPALPPHHHLAPLLPCTATAPLLHCTPTTLHWCSCLSTSSTPLHSPPCPGTALHCPSCPLPHSLFRGSGRCPGVCREIRQRPAQLVQAGQQTIQLGSVGRLL